MTVAYYALGVVAGYVQMRRFFRWLDARYPMPSPSIPSAGEWMIYVWLYAVVWPFMLVTDLTTEKRRGQP